MADSEETLFSLQADPSGVLDAFQLIVEAVDELVQSINGLASGLGSLDDLATAMQDVAGSAGEAGAAAGEMGARMAEASAESEGLFSQLGDLGEGMMGVAERAGEMAGAFIEFQAIGDLINTVHNFVSSMFDMNSSFQKLNVTLTNFVGAQQAADITNWAKNFAQTVPFTTEAVQQAVVAVTALGQNAEQVVPALVTVASQMGVSLPTASQALLDAQNNLWRMMERDLHITKDQLVEFGLDVNDGAQGIKDTLIPAFEKFASTKFPNATSDYMHTLAGETAELNDKLQLLAATMGQPLFDLFQQTAGEALDWLNSHQDDVDHFATLVGQDLAQGFKDLGAAIQFAWPFLQDVYQIASGLVSGSFSVLMDLVKGGAQAWKDLSGGMQTVVVPFQGIATAAGNFKTGMSGTPEMVSGFTTQLQNLQGPLTPVKQMLEGLGTDLQNIVKWFEPIPGKTQMVTEKVKEWVDTGDGMGKWVSVTKQVNEVTPGQDSPFVQWLKSIGDAFAQGFGDDSKHTKLQELAQALDDLVKALTGLASDSGKQATGALQGLAEAIGGAASHLADFFGSLQKSKEELTLFKGILEILRDLLAAKLLVSVLAFAGKGLGALIDGGTSVLGVFGKLIKQQSDWLNQQEAALEPTEQTGEAIQQTGEEAQTAADEGIQAATEGMQQLSLQVQTTGQRFGTMPEQILSAEEAFQQFAEGSVNGLREALLSLQEQKDALGEDFSGTFSGQVVDADSALTTFSERGVVNAETGLDDLKTKEATVGDFTQTTFVQEIGTGQAALTDIQTVGVANAKAGLDDLKTEEGTVADYTQTTFATEMEVGTTAIANEGDAASTSAGQLTSDLAPAEKNAGEAATTAIGTPGSQSGGGLGILGLFFALQWLGQEMQQFDTTVGNSIADWMKKQFNNMGLSDTWSDGFKKANDQVALNQKQMEGLMNQGIQDAINFANSVNESFAGIDTGATSQQLYNILNAAQVTFDGIKNSAQSNLGSVESILGSTFSNLTGQGYTWGNAFTQAFANGIASALGSVDASASQVMQHVHRYVGVESPTEAGPGQHLMEWGPNLVKEFAQGMLSQVGLVSSAAEAIMQQARQGLTAQGAPGVGGIPITAFSSGLTAASAGSSISMARVEMLLDQLVQQGYRLPALGATPSPATTGSIYQQFGSLNINGVQNMPTLAAELNMLAGLAYEFAQRGAINGAAW
jgi:hypothetical protein